MRPMNLALPEDLQAALRAHCGPRGIAEAIAPVLRAWLAVLAEARGRIAEDKEAREDDDEEEEVDEQAVEDEAIAAAVSLVLGVVTRKTATPHGWEQRGRRWVARAGSHDLPRLIAEAAAMGLDVEGPPSVPLTGRAP